MIELHESLFKKDFPSTAQVKALPKVKNARQIEIEPINDSDWELMDCFSTYLEDGGLLQQVSIVFPNQKLALKLPCGDVVYALVKPFPDCDCPCLRLVEDSEVTILTKSRMPQFNIPSDPFRVLPVDLDIECCTLQAGKDEGYKVNAIQTPSPFYVHIHPQTIQNVPGYSQPLNTSSLTVLLWRTSTLTNIPLENKDQTLDSSVALAKLVSSPDVPLNHVGM